MGPLPEESFARYVIQDALYLRDCARALAAIASRAPTASATRMFAGMPRTRSRPNWKCTGSSRRTGNFPGIGGASRARPDELGLYELPAGHGARRKLRGRRRRGATLLLDLRGGRQGTAAPRFARFTIPAVDRHPRGDEYGAVAAAVPEEPDRVSPSLSLAHPGDQALPDHEPVRVDAGGRWGMPGNPGRPNRSKPLQYRLTKASPAAYLHSEIGRAAGQSRSETLTDLAAIWRLDGVLTP